MVHVNRAEINVVSHDVQLLSLRLHDFGFQDLVGYVDLINISQCLLLAIIFSHNYKWLPMTIFPTINVGDMH
jgi:hypothetical protein